MLRMIRLLPNRLMQLIFRRPGSRQGICKVKRR